MAPPDPKEHYIELGVDLGTSATKVYYSVRGNDGTICAPPALARPGNRNSIPTIFASFRGTMYFGADLEAKVRSNMISPDLVVVRPKLGYYEEHWKSSAPSVRHLKALVKDENGLDSSMIRFLRHVVREVRVWISQSATLAWFTSEDIMAMETRVRLTVPQMWSPIARIRMQNVAKQAGAKIIVLASEPQSGVASWCDDVAAAGITNRIKKGDGIVLVDGGSGTLDLVYYRAQGPLNANSELKAVRQSTGAVYGSYKINELVLEKLEWANGLDLEKAARHLDMSQQELKWRLEDKIEAIKVSNNVDPHNAITICNTEGQSITVKFTMQAFREASRKVEMKVTSMIRKLLGDNLKPKFIIMAGGLSRSDHVFEEVHQMFHRDECEVFRIEDEHSTKIAKGAISPRYDAIDVQALPKRFAYALLQDEVFQKNLHGDCTKPGYELQPVPNKKKVMPDPFNRKQKIVIDRFKILLTKNEDCSEEKTVEANQVFRVSADDPKLTVRLVYLDRDHDDHGPALVDDHDAAKQDNPLRRGVHDWAELTARVPIEKLQKHNAKMVMDSLKNEFYEVSAQLKLKCKDEANITITWALTFGKNGTHEDESPVWDAHFSEFSSEHDQHNPARLIVDDPMDLDK